MRREYTVACIVIVHGDTRRDFAFAVKDLRKRGFWLERITAGDDVCYSVKAVPGARVTRRKTPKRKVEK